MRRWVARNLQTRRHPVTTTFTSALAPIYVRRLANNAARVVHHKLEAPPTSSLAQQVPEPFNEARAGYALLFTVGIAHDLAPPAIPQLERDTRELELSLPPTSLAARHVAVTTPQPFQTDQYHIFEAVFRQFAITKSPLSNLMVALSNLIHQASTTETAKLTPELVALLLKELALIFCRVKDEEMVPLARTWLGLLDLASSMHRLTPHQQSTVCVPLAAAEGLLKMVEHVKTAATSTRSRHNFRTLHQVESMLCRRMDGVIQVVDQRLWVDGCYVTGSHVDVDVESRRLKVLIRHGLLSDGTRDIVMRHWPRMMALLFGEGRRWGKAPVGVVARCRSSYMRILQDSLRFRGEDSVAIPPLGLLAESYILLLRIPNNKFEGIHTRRFARLWRKVFIRMIEREAEWDGPDGWSAVLEVYLGVLRRHVINVNANSTTPLVRDLSEKVFLPYVTRGIFHACIHHAFSKVHGSRRRKAKQRVVTIFEVLGVDWPSVTDEATRRMLLSSPNSTQEPTASSSEHG
ncbi:hypothetical protein FRB95_002264 [Tulasnella sp. JGI-2019a]|nr:hypothetical protein FRB95_002264 [Tulasnella sp. JGI-2019a]